MRSLALSVPPAPRLLRSERLRRAAQERAVWLADHAVRALIAEALLTPKPALVDQRGPGAHQDLDLERLLRSAESLRGSFQSMALQARGAVADLQLREKLGAIGRHAERRMLSATGGSNAHRGAIWVLGLLVAALAIAEPGEELEKIAAIAAGLARLPDRYAPQVPSNGSHACRRFGVPGARGEAASGFPHVLHVGLPALQRARLCGADETRARLDALMAIMARLDDTCLLHRGGRPALNAAQAGAQRVLALGGTSTAAGWGALLALDAELLRRRASPGGCADLLGACLLLDGVQSAGAKEQPWNA
jgi:triphosphoribosyl-dephospho-CoA synthase